MCTGSARVKQVTATWWSGYKQLHAKIALWMSRKQTIVLKAVLRSWQQV
jgi:hypothetical protein